jgi:serine/threonine protein kinase
MKKIDNEQKIHKLFRHNNVVKFYEYLNDQCPTHYLIIMELCQGGDLLKYIRRRKNLDENTAKYFFKQLIVGLDYIHSQNVVHCDIKVENILIDNEGTIKISDFGLS